MTITRDDLTTDPLLPLINEESKPALTLSELFDTERIVIGAVKNQISNTLDWLNNEIKIIKKLIKLDLNLLHLFQCK